MKIVVYQKQDSIYDDVTGVKYHFPSQYLSRVQSAKNDWIVYYGPIRGKPSRYYSGVARLVGVRDDDNREKHYYADLADYIDFYHPVDYREYGGYETKLVKPDGSVSGGQAQNAVRQISDAEFASIIRAGLSSPEQWPDRDEDDEPDTVFNFGEEPQDGLIGEPYDRAVIEQLTRRKWRDRKFKQHIRIAYDRTCSFTGLRLINGKGRPEVEAAHIRPVELGGNDWIRNGIALSGTVHWMFDRGLLSLSDDFIILRSRQLNHDVSNLLNKDMTARVPSDVRLQPHPEYMRWHRENVFKG